MLRCCRCRAIFREEDAGYGREYVGEFWGAPAYESVDLCPECNSSDIEDAEEEEEE